MSQKTLTNHFQLSCRGGTGGQNVFEQHCQRGEGTNKHICLKCKALVAKQLTKHAPFFSGLPDIFRVYAVLGPPSFRLASSSVFLPHARKVFILVVQKKLFCINSS